VAMEKDPDSIETLNSYIQFFDEYLEKGLLEENLLKRQRILYSQVLDRKLEMIENDRDTLIKKLRNAISLKNYTAADEAALALRNDWPLDEDTWIESLRVTVEQKDHNKFRQIMDEMHRKPVRWTQFGKEKVAYWMQ
ncbi:MAG: hypothetical protein LWX83_16885, partial [Anaerolineae bacterium]|nr:hypothetical protein [Anaerolineae bacterium]